MKKHFVPVTIVLLTLAGCGTTANSGSADRNQTANSSSSSVASKSPEATNNTTSTTSTTTITTSVPISPDSTTTSQSSDASEIVLIKKKGYSPIRKTPNAITQTRSGDTLAAWITIAIQSQDGYNQLVFFFLNGKYLGTDTTKPSAEITSVKAAGNGIAVTYPVYEKNDSFSNPTGEPVTITYTWNGSELVPNKPYPKQF